MANEKNIKSRIQLKHDTEENWLKATNFIPKQGEMIIYDIDSTYDYERMKIGDGIKNVNALPFYVGEGGEDGYTPVRGVDYWTEEDKAEIKSYVDEAILGGAW